ncbi:MAG: ABC transporter permease subunit, partial [Pseudomonadales bacterium]
LPAVTLGVNLIGTVARKTRSAMLEVLGQDYIRTARAKGLLERVVLTKHALRNAMLPVVTVLGLQFANLLGESQQRIKSMSLIHENLYQSDNLLEIDFEDYINMLANSLCRFYTIPGVSIGLDIQVEDVNLDIETAVPCGLIINELISNSLKHAFVGKEGRGTISVSFRNTGCRYVLQISDNGIGLPEDFEPSSSSSMGMEIVSILTQQLDGRLHIDGRCGASFEISFPRKEKASV